jgi:hypothetical protein
MNEREPAATSRTESVDARLEQAQESGDETRLQTLEDLYGELEKGLEDSTSGV